MNPIFKSEYTEISLDLDQKIIRANWYGFLKINDLLQGMEQLLKGIRDHHIQRHISDQTRLKVLTKDIKAYLQKDALKNMEEAGLKKVGIIQAGDLFARVAVDLVNKKASINDLSIEVFDNETDCLNWLNT